ncbi:MAG: thioredoxin domain-containing protein [bacterium]
MEDQKRGFFDGNPKMVFVFGLVAGVAVTVLVGGNFSLPTLGNDDGDDEVVREFENEGADDQPMLAAVTADENILGDIENAKVVMVVYSDFECPYCAAHHPNVEQIVEDFGDDVAVVFRHFPLNFHANARPAALASECAAEQGKFWEFADMIFANQSKMGDEYYSQVATALGLNSGDFTSCVDELKYASDIEADIASAMMAGVTGTPATFVNGMLVSGAVPYETLAELVASELVE